MGYTEQLYRAQNAALERAYMASLQPPDDYYFDTGSQDDVPEDEWEEEDEE